VSGPQGHRLTLEVSDDDAESLRELGSRLRTQENGCTETPAFAVQEWCETGDDGELGDWRTVQFFLTGSAADRYLRSNLHNLRKPKEKDKQPRVYIVGGYRNYERQLLRRVLMALPPPTTPRSWRDVLGFADESVVDASTLERRCSWLERDAHPSGAPEINAARAAALAEIGAKKDDDHG
jgi:hypothetical protein